MMKFEVGDAVTFKGGKHKNCRGTISAVRIASDEKDQSRISVIEYSVTVTTENGLQRQLKAATGELRKA